MAVDIAAVDIVAVHTVAVHTVAAHTVPVHTVAVHIAAVAVVAVGIVAADIAGRIVAKGLHTDETEEAGLNGKHFDCALCEHVSKSCCPVRRRSHYRLLSAYTSFSHHRTAICIS